MRGVWVKDDGAAGAVVDQRGSRGAGRGRSSGFVGWVVCRAGGGGISASMTLSGSCENDWERLASGGRLVWRIWKPFGSPLAVRREDERR